VVLRRVEALVDAAQRLESSHCCVIGVDARQEFAPCWQVLVRDIPDLGRPTACSVMPVDHCSFDQPVVSIGLQNTKMVNEN